MVSFQCDGCADTVKKPKLDSHRQKCWSTFTCLDCSTTFQNQDYKTHTSCISEAEKYQGALYKGKKAKGHQGNQPSSSKPTFTSAPPVPIPSTSTSTSTDSTPAPSAPAPSIHPSRMAMLPTSHSTPAPSRPTPTTQNGRPSFPPLHPPATYSSPNGQYPAPMVKAPRLAKPGRQFGRSRAQITGPNAEGAHQMRSWGSGENTPTSSPPPPPAAPVSRWPTANVAPTNSGFTTAYMGEAVPAAKAFAPQTREEKQAAKSASKKEKKANKAGGVGRKDKGGTGSRANSNKAKEEALAAAAAGGEGGEGGEGEGGEKKEKKEKKKKVELEKTIGDALKQVKAGKMPEVLVKAGAIAEGVVMDTKVRTKEERRAEKKRKRAGEGEGGEATAPAAAGGAAAGGEEGERKIKKIKKSHPEEGGEVKKVDKKERKERSVEEKKARKAEKKAKKAVVEA